MSTDFYISDAILVHLRRLDLEISRIKDRIAQLERPAMPPEYDGHMPGEITDHEAYGAMIHAMRPREDMKDEG